MQPNDSDNLVKKIIAVPWRRKLLLAEAIFWLITGRVARLILPFKHFKVAFGTVGLSSAKEVDQSSYIVTNRLCSSVISAANFLPFETACLEQAFAANKMLALRNIRATTYLGVRKERRQRYNGKPGEIAHAWVRVGKRICVGGNDVSGYHIVAHFSQDN